MKRQYGRHMKKMYRIKSLKCSVLCALVIVLCCACHNAAQIDQELDRKTESSDNSLSTEASENSVSDAGEQNQSESDVPEETEESVAETPKILRTEVKVKGIYVTGPMAGSSGMEKLIDLVNTTELNTMVIDVKNDEGIITYQMELPENMDIQATVSYVSDMPALVQRLHEQGIYVIARICCYKDPRLAEAKPELALCLPNGKPVMDANNLAWVNPYKEEVWDYLCTLAECAIRDGFDEVQFDYVRFPIGNDARNADYGVDLDAYPREQCLTNFFQYTGERLHQQGILFGADLFGTVIGSEADRDSTGQNYGVLAGIADNLCPMIYPSHYANGTFGLNVPDAKPYETIKGAMKRSDEELALAKQSVVSGNDADVPVEQGVIRPWLQCFTATWVEGHITYGSEQIQAQIQAVYDAGYDEFLLWNASNRYAQVPEALNNLKD